MKRFIPYILSLSAVITASCVKEDPNGIIQPDPEVTPKPDSKPEQAAVSFSSIMQEEISSTRAGANTRAQEGLKKDFVVYGYKTMTENSSPIVFNGYNVTYNANSSGTSAENSHNYSYVNGTTQTIKYWDFGASEYNFWGATGGTFSNQGTKLTLESLEQSVTEPNVAEKMFSVLNHRSPVTSDVVTLEFMRPYAKVRVMYYCGEALDDGDKVEIGTSTMGPESPASIVKSGTLTITYPVTGDSKETYSTTSNTTENVLAFKTVQLTHEVGTASNNAALAKPEGGTEYYFVVPYIYTTPFILSTTIEGDAKTAVIPAAFMQWKPNYIYTYIFKITEAGKKIEFYDVMIDPWKYGGSQEEEWKNW